MVYSQDQKKPEKLWIIIYADIGKRTTISTNIDLITHEIAT
jgi:hypothetical protein